MMAAAETDVVKGLTSVLVAVYNVAPYLDECIASIIGQSERNLEIILIDDASTDGSGEIADSWAERDPRIRVVRKAANAGLYDSRNLSVDLARGEYIAFVDGDDYIEHTMLSDMVGQLEKTDADVAICGWLDLSSDKMTDRSLEVETGTVANSETALTYCFPEMGDMRYSPFVWNKLFRRRAILDEAGQPIRFNDSRIACEDTTWLARILMRVDSVVFVQDALYVYRSQRPGNKTGSASIDARLAISSVEAFSECWKLLDEHGHSCASNMLQRTLVQQQRGMFAAIESGDEEVWRRCSDHYLRDVGAWFASSPSIAHLAWCAKRIMRRVQLEIRHRVPSLFVKGV